MKKIKPELRKITYLANV